MAKKTTQQETEEEIRKTGCGGMEAKAPPKSSEELLKTVFRNIRDGILFACADTRKFILANDAMCRMLGCGMEEILTLSVADIHPAEDLPWVQAEFDRLLRGDIELARDIPVKRRDGSVFFADINCVNFELAGKSGILGVFRDITDRKRTEDLLRAARLQLQVTIEALPDILFEVDLQGRIYYFRAPQPGILYVSPEKFMGRTIQEVLPEEASRIIIEAIARAAETGRDRGAIYSLDMPDGLHWFELSIAVKGDLQTPDGRLIALVRDITERKKSEDSVRESERRFRELFECSRDGFVVVNDHGGFMDANLAYCEMVGYSLEELHSMDSFYQITPEKWRQWEKEEIWNRRLLVEGHSGVYEKEYIRRDGTVFPVELYAFAVFGTDGTYRYLWAVVRDITERKRAEEEREKLQAQLVQANKMESVGRLAGGVAHDFNNMLGVIMGRAELALMISSPSDPLYAHLKEIEDAARRSADLTRQLLAFARKQAIVPRVLDFNETVAGMLKMLQRIIGEDITLVWEPGSDLWRIKMDPSQIDQVLVNLCANARDAIAGTGRVVIATGNVASVEAREQHPGMIPGEYVKLVVSDNGCGIEPAMLEHIFEPFFTTKGLRKGTGLGMATVYGIVTQNRGFIGVNSEPGQGTTIKIFLPRYIG